MKHQDTKESVCNILNHNGFINIDNEEANIIMSHYEDKSFSIFVHIDNLTSIYSTIINNQGVYMGSCILDNDIDLTLKDLIKQAKGDK